jgi:hypothetical protein
MTYATAFIITVFVCALLVAVRRYLQIKANSALEYQTATDGFFNSIKPIVDDDETPDEILDIIRGFGATITDKHIPMVFLSYLRNDRWRHPEWGLQNKILAEFFHRRPELEKSFEAALLNWFRAVTSLSPLVGAAVRTAMMEEKLKSAAVQVTAKSRQRLEFARHETQLPPHIRGAKT